MSGLTNVLAPPLMCLRQVYFMLSFFRSFGNSHSKGKRIHREPVLHNGTWLRGIIYIPFQTPYCSSTAVKLTLDNNTRRRRLSTRPPICTTSTKSVWFFHSSTTMASSSGVATISGTHSQLQPRRIDGTIFSNTSLSFSICLNGLAALAVELLSNTLAISHRSIHSVRGMMQLLAQIVHLLPPDSFFSAVMAKSS
jgi:hypothetical protein